MERRQYPFAFSVPIQPPARLMLFPFLDAQALSCDVSAALSFGNDAGTRQSCMNFAADQQLFGPHSNSAGPIELRMEWAYRVTMCLHEIATPRLTRW